MNDINTNDTIATPLIADVREKFSPNLSFAGMTSGSTLESIEKVMTPAIAKDGSRSYFTNIVKLIWSNEERQLIATFGCLICGQQGAKQQAIGIHIGKVHNGKSGLHKKKPQDLMELLNQMIEEQKQKTEMWEKRAKIAEKKLAQLRSVFGVGE